MTLRKIFYRNRASRARVWPVFHSKYLFRSDGENELLYFKFVLWYFRHFSGSPCINVRVRFFNSDHAFAARFLKFCVLFALESYPFLDRLNYFNSLFDMVSELQFFCLLVKYVNYGGKYFDGLGTDIQDSFWGDWCDGEFTWLIYNLVFNFYTKFSIIELPLSIPNSRWWTNVNLFQYYFPPRPLLPKVKVEELVFDFGRKFLFGNAGFASWQAQKMNNRQYSNSSINNRFMFSFQVQFNYSDIFALESHVSNFRQVHLFNPIFKEMHDLPFLLSSLRPGFQNLPLMHIYNSIDKLHYTAVYPLQTGPFAQFIFDKYLYTHARALISLPDRYFSFVEGQYFVNFGSISRLSDFYSYCNYVTDWVVVRRFRSVAQMFDSVGNARVFDFDFKVLLNQQFMGFHTRQRFISQIIANFWHVLSHLQRWFESVNYFFFENFRGSKSTDNFGSHDLVNIFLGPLNAQNFERITRRVLLEFSKFLYSSSFLVILFMLEVSEGQLRWSSFFTQFNGLFDIGYDSTLTELEADYRYRQLNSIHNRRHFSSFGFESIEQFYDYELWLYVFFSELVTLCRDNI